MKIKSHRLIITLLMVFVGLVSVSCVQVGDYGASVYSPTYPPSPQYPSSSPSSSSMSAAQLAHSRWKLVDMPHFRQYQSAYEQFSLLFEGRRLSGQAFNRFSSSVMIGQQGRLRVSSSMQSTKKLIMDKQLSQLEKKYLSLILTASSWKVRGRYLTLSGNKGRLVFVRQ